MKCKMCDGPFPDKYNASSDELCTNCWEVTSRLRKFVESWNGRMFTISILNKEYTETLGKLTQKAREQG